MKHSDEILWLDPQKVVLSRVAAHSPLRLVYDGNEPSHVRAHRAFPQRHPDGWIQLEELKPDGKDAKQIGLIRRLADLDESSRQLIQEDLERTYAVPRINSIISMQEGRNVIDWEVETNLGICRFRMIQPHRHVIPAGGGRVILIDDEENRYDIPDDKLLDARSRRLLERII